MSSTLISSWQKQIAKFLISSIFTLKTPIFLKICSKIIQFSHDSDNKIYCWVMIVVLLFSSGRRRFSTVLRNWDICWSSGLNILGWPLPGCSHAPSLTLIGWVWSHDSNIGSDWILTCSILHSDLREADTMMLWHHDVNLSIAKNVSMRTLASHIYLS